MAIETLDHCAIRSHDLEGTKDFFVDVIGLTVGERPPVDFPGYWLYSGDTAIVHLFGGSDDGGDQDELTKYLGAKDPESLNGSGAIDHLAFKATGLAGMRARLDDNGLTYFERTLPQFGLHQVFVKDPNGVTLELNYPAEEATATTRAAAE